MRRSTSPFSLSLLDLLTSALGAVILLFVLVPKGGAGAAVAQQAAIFFDTATMQIHGALPESLAAKRAGDTVLALLVDYRPVDGPDVGGLEAALVAERRRAAAAEAKRARAAAAANRAEAARQLSEARAEREARARQRAAAKRKPAPRVAQVGQPTPTTPAPTKPDPSYRGTPPSVPARLSFELTWADKSDNVDLFVCQGNTCVYGDRKRDGDIGQWDSGKSRNRLFGNDLRTNQEALRQFDRILPGTYTLYARFKESERGREKVRVSGLVYTKDDAGKPRGHTYSDTIALGDARTRLITVTVAADGTFTTR